MAMERLRLIARSTPELRARALFLVGSEPEARALFLVGSELDARALFLDGFGLGRTGSRCDWGPFLLSMDIGPCLTFFLFLCFVRLIQSINLVIIFATFQFRRTKWAAMVLPVEMLVNSVAKALQSLKQRNSPGISFDRRRMGLSDCWVSRYVWVSFTVSYAGCRSKRQLTLHGGSLRLTK